MHIDGHANLQTYNITSWRPNRFWKETLDEYRSGLDTERAEIVSILQTPGCTVFDTIDCSQSFLTRHYCVYNALQIFKMYGHRIYFGYVCRNVSTLYPDQQGPFFTLMEHAWNVDNDGNPSDFTLSGDLDENCCYVGHEISCEEAQRLLGNFVLPSCDEKTYVFLDSNEYRDNSDKRAIELSGMTQQNIDLIREAERTRFFNYWKIQ